MRLRSYWTRMRRSLMVVAPLATFLIAAGAKWKPN